MAWVQASIAAYYVAYAENPQSQQFDSTIPDYIREIERSQVQNSQELVRTAHVESML